MLLVGDTGFEPVTSSVSGQNICLGMRISVASGACVGRLYSPLCGLVGLQFGRLRSGFVISRAAGRRPRQHHGDGFAQVSLDVSVQRNAHTVWAVGTQIRIAPGSRFPQVQ